MRSRSLYPYVFYGLTFAAMLPGTAHGATREGILVFTPPSRWMMQTDSGTTRFASPDKTASFSIGRSQPMEGTLDKAFDAQLEEARALPQFREESRQAGGRHNASGGQYKGFVYSYAAPGETKFTYVWVCVLGAGGRWVAVTTRFSDMKAYTTHGESVAATINGARLTSTEIVEAGTPALTRYALDETLDFLEWLLQTPLTADQKTTVETELRGYWKAKNQQEIEGIMELLTARDQLALLKPAERDLARQAISEGALEEWRKDQTSPSAKMILGIYDNAHKPIATGSPPLTRQAVDAFAEFIFFAAGQTAGTTATPGAELKTQLAGEVARGYSGMEKDQRELIAGMPLVWAALRVAWPDLPEDQKRAYVAEWKQNETIVKLGEALKATEAVAASTATASSGTAAQRATYDASRDMMNKQMQLQMQQRHFQMMQSMMQQSHDTQRMIISNLGGNTSYQYRWR